LIGFLVSNPDTDNLVELTSSKIAELSILNVFRRMFLQTLTKGLAK
jgi:hypothetical protein